MQLPLLVRGALAGAAGTTVLNALTYGDMAVRGRPASSATTDVVEAVAARLPADVPGAGDTRENRVEGIGPLQGIAVGVGVGMAAGLAHRWVKLPTVVAGALIGAAAMALTDLPMFGLGVSDPKEWDAASWLSDAIPHLGYGLVTALAIHAGDR